MERVKRRVVSERKRVGTERREEEMVFLRAMFVRFGCFCWAQLGEVNRSLFPAVFVRVRKWRGEGKGRGWGDTEQGLLLKSIINEHQLKN